MKILMVVSWFTSKSKEKISVGIFHYEQAMAIKQHCDIRLYWPLDTEIDGIEKGVENSIYIYRSPLKRNKSKLYWICSSIKYLEDICREYKPDIIHANVAIPAGVVCVIVGKKLGIPVVHTEHAPIEEMHINNPVRRIIRGYVYKNCVKNICVSDDSKKRLGAIYPNIKFDIIYNGVINPENCTDDNIRYAKDGVVNCCIIAAFYHEFIKGYQFLLPAMSELKKRNIKVHLHICGGGEYKETYIRLAKELKIEDVCTFYGQCSRNKVYSIVKQCDFNISASLYECSGVSVQEAMLLGKPLVVTKSGGANSLCREFTAIEIEKNSIDALVNGIIQMTNEYMNFDANKISQYALRNFEMSSVTDRHIEMYNLVLQDSHLEVRRRLMSRRLHK